MWIFAVLLLIQFTNGIFYDKVYPDWDELSVTAMKYSKLPKTQDDAVKNGWKMDKDACSESSFFYGKRYLLNGDITTMLLYDVTGRVAGIQMSLPKSEIASTQKWIGKAAILDGNTYAVTAYFTDPKQICNGTRVTKKGYVGDKLFLSIGNDTYMEIPLKEKDVDSSKWGNGRCFYGMGQHYWYKVSEDMSCDDFFPYFLLYNGGDLNAFGFASSGDVKSSRAEHPPKSAFGWFFKTIPKCFYKQDVLSTQHVYLQRRPYLNFC